MKSDETERASRQKLYAIKNIVNSKICNAQNLISPLYLKSIVEYETY